MTSKPLHGGRLCVWGGERATRSYARHYFALSHKVAAVLERSAVGAGNPVVPSAAPDGGRRAWHRIGTHRSTPAAIPASFNGA